MNVVYENADVLVIEKPAGMPSQPDPSGDADALTLAAAETGVPLYLVHRLDRTVGGLLLFAKTGRAAAQYSELVRTHTMQKIYLCICEGDLPPQGEMADLLFHDKRKGKAFVVTRRRDGVKEASLSYRILASRAEVATTYHLCEVTLHSGRFHQIRVQFASRACPLVGDGKYGSRQKSAIALFATRLSFPTREGSITVRALPDTAHHPWSMFSEELL